MNIKDFSISAARTAQKHFEVPEGPSMVDPTVHNPSLQEILERFTKTGQLICSQREAYYDPDDNDDFTEPQTFDDLADIFPSTSDDAPAQDESSEDEPSPHNPDPNGSSRQKDEPVTTQEEQGEE